MKNKNDNGNILLEMLLMVAILMIIFPIIQKNIKNRSDALRNGLVVKDMMKLKTSLENYTKRRPDIAPGITDIPFSILEENGLPKGFKNTNIIGQNYSVKVRRSDDGENTVYDAIIIADGNSDLPDLRIREIVKDSKGYGGYIEDDIIYGANWSLDGRLWGTLDPKSIIFKTGFAKKDYQYISRNGYGSSKMNTDLYMNLNNINNIGQLFVADTINVSNLLFGSATPANDTAKINKLSIDDTLTFNQDIDIVSGSISIPEGLKQNSLTMESAATTSLYIDQVLNIGGKLITDSTSENIFRYAIIDDIMTYSPVEILVGNMIRTPRSTQSVLGTTIELSSLNIDGASMNSTGTYPDALTFMKILSQKDNEYNINVNTATLNTQLNMFDIVVKKVNEKLAGKKIGGIDITDRTPISVIIRALNYEYADIYNVTFNNYPGEDENRPIKGWTYIESSRCWTIECLGDYWVY